jgi:TM2 domain-containing membrane protein YozV
MKSKFAAAMLAFFLGGLGVHKFYLDQSGTGLFYLIFCWTGIPMVIAFFEGIVYLTTSEQAFQRKYGNQQAPAQLPQAAPSQTAQNVTVNMAGQGPGVSVSDELKKLSDLRTAGVLTDAEFQAQKQKLLQ